MPRGKLSNPKLARLYEQEELSLTAIAKYFGVSKQAVHYRLKQSGVEMRSSGRKLPDITVLIDLYENQKLTATEIAKKYGYTGKAGYFSEDDSERDL